jgi:predicted hotdog family 3-hydroxylacyl-ACP dehydratase
MTSVAGPFSERIIIQPGWPHFVGHFVGRPILPGIAHLALVRDALRRMVDPELELVAVTVLRLRQVVEPGDELELQMSSTDEAEWTFELRRGADLASRGMVASGRCAAPGAAAGGVWAGGERFPTPEALIPHRGPALLLETVVEAADDRLVASAAVPQGSAFAAQGLAPSFVALEVAAQAAAAFEALRRRRAGGDPEPRVGYLVGARDVVLQTGLPVGLPLQVTIRLDAALPPLSTYLFEVGAGGTVAANGTISTYMA